MGEALFLLGRPPDLTTSRLASHIDHHRHSASMARRPVLCTFLYPPACLPHIRYFSKCAVQSAGGMKAMPQNRPPAQKSMKVAAREAMKGDAIPSDFGLLPGT